MSQSKNFLVKLKGNAPKLDGGQYGPSGCPAPTGLLATPITSSSALVSWQHTIGASIYDLRYRVVGQPAWVTISVDEDETITGLQPGEQYEVQIRARYPGGCISDWITTYFTSEVQAVLAFDYILPVLF